jgi:hypothetical protein
MLTLESELCRIEAKVDLPEPGPPQIDIRNLLYGAQRCSISLIIDLFILGK